MVARTGRARSARRFWGGRSIRSREELAGGVAAHEEDPAPGGVEELDLRRLEELAGRHHSCRNADLLPHRCALGQQDAGGCARRLQRGSALARRDAAAGPSPAPHRQDAAAARWLAAVAAAAAAIIAAAS